MPELPEVETVKRGLECLIGQKIKNVIIRNYSLRYPITHDLVHQLINKKIVNISRRAKYLIVELEIYHLIIHLGMSGSVTLTTENILKKHDHVDIILSDTILRYNDPRRFGCILYTDSLATHPLLKNLGPEPLTEEFNAKYLFGKINKRNSTIKQLIMDNGIVVGVGNIYACEALFLAKILPARAGSSISMTEVSQLVKSIKQVLDLAIKLGGSSLRDYKKADGNLGYFQNIHNVYGKNGQKCTKCNNLILEKRLGQRNSFYCPKCQQ